MSGPTTTHKQKTPILEVAKNYKQRFYAPGAAAGGFFVTEQIELHYHKFYYVRFVKE